MRASAAENSLDIEAHVALPSGPAVWRSWTSSDSADAEAADGFRELSTVVGEGLAAAEVAFVLTAAGLLVLAVWVAAPRRLWTIPVGSLVLALGIFGLVTLPVGGAAAVLLALAAASLLMEVLAAPGLLLHATGGAVALVLAGLCLHHPWSGAHPLVTVPTALLTAAGTWLAARRSWRAIRADPFTRPTLLVGREAVILDADEDVGHAVVAGQLWTVHGSHHDLKPGCVVRVTCCTPEGLIVELLRGDADG